jgi:hypothetical protein
MVLYFFWKIFEHSSLFCRIFLQTLFEFVLIAKVCKNALKPFFNIKRIKKIKNTKKTCQRVLQRRGQSASHVFQAKQLQSYLMT